MSKITSAIADYAIHYDLLHYHYDCWLFNTITGAINSGIKAQCSLTTSFDAKTFSHQYWANQHRYLINPVRQFGSPVFITISPFEGTFPFPPWLNNLRNETGKGPTELAIPETIHIAHVLEQYIRGYLCCSNTNSWKNHLFIKNSDPCEQREQLLLQVRSPEEGYTPRAYSHMAQGHERHGCDQAVDNDTTGKH